MTTAATFLTLATNLKVHFQVVYPKIGPFVCIILEVLARSSSQIWLRASWASKERVSLAKVIFTR